jgi:hypothetical protein
MGSILESMSLLKLAVAARFIFASKISLVRIKQLNWNLAVAS